MVSRKGVALVGVLVLACDQAAILDPEPAPVTLTAEQAYEIATAPETTVFLELGHEYLRRVDAALSAGVTVAQVRGMQARSDVDLALVLFGTVQAAEQYGWELEAAVTQLLERFPVLGNPGLEIPACDPLDAGPVVYLEGVGQIAGDVFCGMLVHAMRRQLGRSRRHVLRRRPWSY